MRHLRVGVRGWLAIVALGSLVFAACSTGDNGGDAGTEAGVESGPGDSNQQETCGSSLCTHGDQPPECPSCSPSNGDICSPPAAVTCNYTNGCSQGQEISTQCTCVLPDASTSDAADAADAGDGGTTPTKAIWSCKFGV